MAIVRPHCETVHFIGHQVIDGDRLVDGLSDPRVGQ